MNAETVKWRFLDTGKGNAIFNMAMDEAILSSVRSGVSPPVFRIYEWKSDAITFGYSQNILNIVDVEKCASNGIEITRRLTGGRAVYHKNELAYSVTGFIDDERFGGTIAGTYRSISAVLAAGLNDRGIGAEITGEKTGAAVPRSRQPEPCFLTASKFEITLDGKKIVGSAQRRFKNVFLQQGSIITGPGSEKIADYMIARDLADEYGKLLAERMIDLRSHSRGQFSETALKDSLFDSFERAAGVTCEHGKPTCEELEHTKRLIEERYGSEGWVKNHG